MPLRAYDDRSMTSVTPSTIREMQGHEGSDREDGEHDGPDAEKAAAEQRVVLEDLSSPVRRRWLDAQADEAEGRDREDRVRDAHDELDEHHGADVGQDLADHDVPAALRSRPCRVDVLQLAFGQHRR